MCAFYQKTAVCRKLISFLEYSTVNLMVLLASSIPHTLRGPFIEGPDEENVYPAIVSFLLAGSSIAIICICIAKCLPIDFHKYHEYTVAVP